MTTNEKLFNIEFYRAADAEESDPDPAFNAEADNPEDLFIALSAFLGEANVRVYQFLHTMEDGSLAYNVIGNHVESLGVAYIVIHYP